MKLLQNICFVHVYERPFNDGKATLPSLDALTLTMSGGQTGARPALLCGVSSLGLLVSRFYPPDAITSPLPLLILCCAPLDAITLPWPGH